VKWIDIPTDSLQKRKMIAAGFALRSRHDADRRDTAHEAQWPIDFYKSWHTATVHRKFATGFETRKEAG
jgi:hypothetical protein